MLNLNSCQDNNNAQISPTDAGVSEKLKTLYRQKKNHENPIINRDGGKMSVNDALDFLNDGLNFTYCRPNDLFLETKVFKDTFVIAVDGLGQIEAVDLNDLVDDIANFAGAKFYAESRSPKESLMFDMKDLSSPSSTYTNIEATFVYEVGNPSTSVDQYPFDDIWIYGQWGGDVSNVCNDEDVDLDAVDLLRRDLRKSLVYRSKVVFYYFKEPYTVCYSAGNDDCFSEEIPEVYFPVNESHQGSELINPADGMTQNDNLYESLLFYNIDFRPGYHTCLSDDEMNFHFESMEDLVGDILPSPAGNNVIAQIEVGYNGLFGEFTTTIHHSMLAVKATKIPITESEFEEGNPLPNP